MSDNFCNFCNKSWSLVHFCLLYLGLRFKHELINCVDTKANCRHLKKLTCNGTLQQVFIRVYRLEIQSFSVGVFVPASWTVAPEPSLWFKRGSQQRSFYVERSLNLKKWSVITINVPVVCMGRDVLIWRRGKSITRAVWRGGPWKSRLFWALKWQRAQRVPFVPKKPSIATVPD